MDSQPNQFSNYRNPQSKTKKSTKKKTRKPENDSPTTTFPNNFSPQQPVQPTNLFGTPSPQQISSSNLANYPLMSPAGNYFPYGQSPFPPMQFPFASPNCENPPIDSTPQQVDYNRFTLQDETDPAEEPNAQHFTQNVVLEDDESEEVEVTRPAKPRRKKGPEKEAKAKAGEGTRIQWTAAEEIALFRAWIDVSENPITGRDQSSNSFWRRVTKSFFEQIGQGEYRTRDCIYSKFTHTNTDLVAFLGILNKTNQNRRSGWDDADVFQFTLKEYTNVKRKPFKYGHLIDLVKKHPKWMNVSAQEFSSGGSSKRSRTTSDGAHTESGSAFDLNDDFEESFHMPERPIGKKRASKAARESTPKSASTASGGTSQKAGMAEELQEEIRKTNLLKQQEQLLKEKEMDLNILREPLEGKTEQEVEFWMMMKAQVMEKRKTMGF